MFNTWIRDARRTRGSSLLDANLEWTWPTSNLDHTSVVVQDYQNVLWYYRGVLSASRLQTVLRRKLLALPEAHSNSNEDDYDLINSSIANDEWQIVSGFSYRGVLTASRLQTVLRRKLLALPEGPSEAHSNSNEDDYDLNNSSIADDEWQVLLS